MEERTLSFRPPADAGPPPAIDGFDVGEEEWQLSLAEHRPLLVDVTGVEPRSDLTLRELATMTARLEGYVEREKRVPKPTGPTDASGSNVPGDWLFDSMRALVTTGFRALGALARRVHPRRGGGAGSAGSVGEQWSVERVHELSIAFRAATETRKREITAARPTSAHSTAGETASDEPVSGESTSAETGPAAETATAVASD